MKLNPPVKTDGTSAEADGLLLLHALKIDWNNLPCYSGAQSEER